MSSYAGSESKYLKAADLNGKRTRCVIAGVELVEFENDGVKTKKPSITFEGKDKAMVCNPTSTSSLNDAFGVDSEDWVGHEVELSTKHYASLGVDGLVLDPIGGAEDEFDDSIPF